MSINKLLLLLCGYFPSLFIIEDLKLISMGVGKELCCYSALVTVHYLVIIPAPWLETIWASRQNVANNMNLFTIQELAAWVHIIIIMDYTEHYTQWIPIFHVVYFAAPISALTWMLAFVKDELLILDFSFNIHVWVPGKQFWRPSQQIAFALFPSRRNFTPLCLSSTRCINV